MKSSADVVEIPKTRIVAMIERLGHAFPRYGQVIAIGWIAAMKATEYEAIPAGHFWEAEPEHQDYLERHPNGYTCHFVRPAWKIAS
jgi:hypothetical protein